MIENKDDFANIRTLFEALVNKDVNLPTSNLSKDSDFRLFILEHYPEMNTIKATYKNSDNGVIKSIMAQYGKIQKIIDEYESTLVDVINSIHNNGLVVDILIRMNTLPEDALTTIEPSTITDIQTISSFIESWMNTKSNMESAIGVTWGDIELRGHNYDLFNNFFTKLSVYINTENKDEGDRNDVYNKCINMYDKLNNGKLSVDTWYQCERCRMFSEKLCKAYSIVSDLAVKDTFPKLFVLAYAYHYGVKPDIIISKETVTTGILNLMETVCGYDNFIQEIRKHEYNLVALLRAKVLEFDKYNKLFEQVTPMINARLKIMDDNKYYPLSPTYMYETDKVNYYLRIIKSYVNRNINNDLYKNLFDNTDNCCLDEFTRKYCDNIKKEFNIRYDMFDNKDDICYLIETIYNLTMMVVGLYNSTTENIKLKAENDKLKTENNKLKVNNRNLLKANNNLKSNPGEDIKMEILLLNNRINRLTRAKDSLKRKASAASHLYYEAVDTSIELRDALKTAKQALENIQNQETYKNNQKIISDLRTEICRLTTIDQIHCYKPTVSEFKELKDSDQIDYLKYHPLLKSFKCSTVPKLVNKCNLVTMINSYVMISNSMVLYDYRYYQGMPMYKYILKCIEQAIRASVESPNNDVCIFDKLLMDDKDLFNHVTKLVNEGTDLPYNILNDIAIHYNRIQKGIDNMRYTENNVDITIRVTIQNLFYYYKFFKRNSRVINHKVIYLLEAAYRIAECYVFSTLCVDKDQPVVPDTTSVPMRGGIHWI